MPTGEACRAAVGPPARGAGHEAGVEIDLHAVHAARDIRDHGDVVTERGERFSNRGGETGLEFDRLTLGPESGRLDDSTSSSRTRPTHQS